MATRRDTEDGGVDRMLRRSIIIFVLVTFGALAAGISLLVVDYKPTDGVGLIVSGIGAGWLSYRGIRRLHMRKRGA